VDKTLAQACSMGNRQATATRTTAAAQRTISGNQVMTLRVTADTATRASDGTYPSLGATSR
jgi:hypothetical protein